MKSLCSVGGLVKNKTEFVSPQQIRNCFIEKNPKRNQSLNFDFRLTFYIPPQPKALGYVRADTHYIMHFGFQNRLLRVLRVEEIPPLYFAPHNQCDHISFLSHATNLIQNFL